MLKKQFYFYESNEDDITREKLTNKWLLTKEIEVLRFLYTIEKVVAISLNFKVFISNRYQERN